MSRLCDRPRYPALPRRRGRSWEYAMADPSRRESEGQGGMNYRTLDHKAVSPRESVSDLLRQIREIAAGIRKVAGPKFIDDINSVTDSIEVLMPLGDEPVSESDYWPNVPLTRNHARLLAALRARL